MIRYVVILSSCLLHDQYFVTTPCALLAVDVKNSSKLCQNDWNTSDQRVHSERAAISNNIIGFTENRPFVHIP